MRSVRPALVASVALLAAHAVPAQSLPLPVTAKPVLDPMPAHALARRFARPAAAPAGVPRGGGAPAAVVNEVERNDTIGYADEFAGQTDYDGNISPTGDVDVVAYDLPFDAVVTFDMSAVGTFPNPDATLQIRDVAGQHVAYNDDRGGGSLWPLIVQALPAGRYFCEVAGVAHSTAGTYRLTVSAVPTAFAALPMNGSTPITVPAGGERGLWSNLPQAVRVNLTIGANGGQDLYLIVLRRTGSVLRVVADSSAGPDPALAAHLPAGQYLLLFGDSNGVGGAATVNMATVVAPIPPLACGGNATGSGTGIESLALYGLTLGAAGTVDVQVTGAGGNPMPDPYLWIFDRNLNVVLHADNVGAVPFPRIITALPPGQYFLGVEPDTNAAAGTFQIALACSAASPPISRIGSIPANIANTAETSVTVFRGGTPFPFEFRTIGAVFQNPVLTVLDASGDVLALSSYSVDLIGNRSSTKDLWVLVRDFAGATGPFRIDGRAPTYFGGPAKGIMAINGKAGQVYYPFVSAALLPFQFPVPAPFTGNVLINPPLLPMSPVTIPAGGSMGYPAFLPNLNYYIQTLALVAAPLGGAMTNVAH